MHFLSAGFEGGGSEHLDVGAGASDAHFIQHPLLFKLCPVIQRVRKKINAAKAGTIKTAADNVVLIKQRAQSNPVTTTPPIACGRRSFHCSITKSKISRANANTPVIYAGQHAIY